MKLVVEIHECPTLTIEQVKQAVKAANAAGWDGEMPPTERMHKDHIDDCVLCAVIASMFDGFEEDEEIQEFVKAGKVSVSVVE